MSKTEIVKNRIYAQSDMDYVGICKADVLADEPKGHRPTDLLPNAKSIIVFGRRLISGSVQATFRYSEDRVGISLSSYSAHSKVLSINQLCMKETYEIAQYLEKMFDCYAMPVTNNVLQAVQPSGNYVPFFADPYQAGLPIDLYKAAVACGIGEMGWNHRVVTPDAGPRVYLCAIVTGLAFEEYDQPYVGDKICDPAKCRVCSEVCPTHALSGTESDETVIGGKHAKVGRLNVNGCACACFGFTKKVNLMASIELGDAPTDEELAQGLAKQFEKPGYQTLDHLPMFYCDRCMLYCPVGNWKEQFAKRGLTNHGGDL